ncbi:MAG: hypothetical protein LBV45_10130 [Xanthomonadaceae bacterium]|nr:hypothetical protein [Xanthomonadaceae bacterium]
MPYYPGEFKLRILWMQGTGHAKTTTDVSLFQYTTDAENQRFAALQRIPLEKYLAQPEVPYARSLFIYTDDPDWLPKPNCDEHCYYFDILDAHAWGNWLRALLPVWIERFLAAPESNENWCWRVLWPHLPRRS